ncbi:MAG: twin-arginine translocase TatA/TatE family subunit [Gammaproteobacteria bacterium]|nr:twin-arginine translocase TatA/TatE family subunit [Gammaproteobacteria bacterium]
MGISGISPWSLLLIIAILILLFGTKRLKNLGKDLGDMIQSFQKSLDTEDQTTVRKKTAKKTKRK